MTRHLLAALGALALAACTDDRPHGTASKGSPPAADDARTPYASSRAGRAAQTGDGAVDGRSANGESAKSPLTAGDQSEQEADRRITQEIRQAVIADPAMSVKARNCTIITINGVVTLRGSVNSISERLSIGRKADGVPGVQRVDNLLAVLP